MDSRNPLIETPRLRMRPHRLDDFDDMATMWADPRVVEHITGTPSTREQSWARLLRYAGHWAMIDFGYWAVEERESGAFIGESRLCRLSPRNRAVPGRNAGARMVLAPRAHGKGYATEAACAAIAWGQEHFPSVPQIACIMVPEHHASIRVAEKCGFTLWTQTIYLDSPILMYKRSLLS